MFKSTRLRLVLSVILLYPGFTGLGGSVSAKEGMWLPATLKNREDDMKSMGLQIPVEQLYNTDGTGLNNAVVLFGKGCTGEVISSKGLLLTNHHCGYGTVQGLSSKEHDYFANGFWAQSMQEELPCPGLTVTFIRKMENVTDKILTGLDDTMSETARQQVISVRIRNLEKGYKTATGLDAGIKPYYNGNQYWVAITETFRDIRLVGFPPNGIGAFGGDSDNWMWPRHTGDFSMFRIYAGKDNKPADYNKDNKPYNPSRFFTINVSGYKENDFTMVYGFPAYTNEYTTSYQLNHIYKIIDPVRIESRTIRLNTWTKNMKASRDIFLKYTSKRAGVANGWKKWQGEVKGLMMNNVIGKKQAYEQQFQAWAAKDESLPYADNLISEIGARSLAVEDLIRTDEYLKESALGVELVQQAAAMDKILGYIRAGITGSSLTDSVKKVASSAKGFYKNYDVNTDKEVFLALMPVMFEKINATLPAEYNIQFAEHGSDYTKWADYVYSSLLSDGDKFNQWAADITNADSTDILTDPAWKLYNSIALYRKNTAPMLTEYNNQMTYLNRLFMKAQMQFDKTKNFYPDANFTLRLSYGNVQGIDPVGHAGYSYQTNLEEAIAKNNPDVEEFKVPEKLIELHSKKDYGKWAVNNTVPIAFIATNHTSGGNSGSPVLNAKGELIGTNFDRVWEGTMSDLNFDTKVCRNITLDVRYTLFIIQKFGGADWLIKEMNIVNK